MEIDNFEKRTAAAKIMQGVLTMQGQAERARWLICTMMLVGLMAMTGCSGFFVPETSGSSGTTTGNYAYVANVTTESLSQYSIGTGPLTTVASPLALGYVPIAMAVTRNNGFLYVAALGDINVYTINSDGSLTASSSGSGVAIAANVVSMDVSPDGQWLLALDGTTLLAQIDVFQINSSTGALTSYSPAQYSIPSAVIVPKMVKISPSGALVFAALDTTTGVLAESGTLSVATTTSDNALAVDSSTSHLYIARSGTGGGVRVFTIGTGGALNEITGSPFASGGLATALALNNTGTYLYAANRTNGTIYGYSIGTTGALTALSGSPYTSGSLVSSLGMDSSGDYLLASATGGSPDLSMYSFDTATPGNLDLTASVATDTDPAGAIAVALTH